MAPATLDTTRLTAKESGVSQGAIVDRAVVLLVEKGQTIRAPKIMTELEPVKQEEVKVTFRSEWRGPLKKPSEK